MKTKEGHYFNNGKNCPFEENGCRYKHEHSDICSYGALCKNLLCQYKHINPDSLPKGHKKVVSEEENEFNVDISKARNNSHTEQESIKNKVASNVQSLNESENENAEVEEISVDKKFTHDFLYTSTPKKRKYQCEGCSQQAQCEDCYLDSWVDNYMTKNKLTK